MAHQLKHLSGSVAFCVTSGSDGARIEICVYLRPSAVKVFLFRPWFTYIRANSRFILRFLGVHLLSRTITCAVFTVGLHSSLARIGFAAPRPTV